MADHDAGAVALCERYAVADVDSHIIEPADLWTARVSSKWGDLVPHVRFHERRQEDYWYVGDRKLYGAGAFAQAGWPEFPPSHPRRLEEAVPAAVEADEQYQGCQIEHQSHRFRKRGNPIDRRELSAVYGIKGRPHPGRPDAGLPG